MEVTNSRFPHWCRIIRKTAENPLIDEGGFSPLDDDYDPLKGDENDEVIDNNDSDSSDGVEETVIYEGACRSYEKNTTSDRGEVISSQRGLSIPLNQDGWNALGNAPREGDEVVVVHGNTNKEYGRIIDKNIATASYAGTHIIWRYGRN